MTEMKDSIRQELASKISDRIGEGLNAKNIQYTPENGSGYYFQCLKPNRPVLVAGYQGQLILMLPFDDYQRLCTEKVTVDGYIESAYFNYGYYRGGGGLISGVYWQPLEEGPGIHNTDRVSRYLHLSHCRMAQWMDVRISEECCTFCPWAATKCQYSPLNPNRETCEGYQFDEPDDRVQLLAAIDERIQTELKFKVFQQFSHDGERDELRLFPGDKPDTVTISVSARLLNDLLYHPGSERDWQQLAQSLVMATTKGDSSEWGKWDEWKIILPPSNQHKHEVCLDLWRKKVTQWERFRATQADLEREKAEQAAAMTELLAPTPDVAKPRPTPDSMKSCDGDTKPKSKQWRSIISNIFNRVK